MGSPLLPKLRRRPSVRRSVGLWTALRERGTRIRAVLGEIDWIFLPPASRDRFGSADAGATVTGFLITWVRTVSVWSLVACALIVAGWAIARLVT